MDRIHQAKFHQEIQFVQKINRIKHKIVSGGADEMNTLEQLTKSLALKEFSHPDMQKIIRETILAANHRKQIIARQFRIDIEKNKALTEIYDAHYPSWREW